MRYPTTFFYMLMPFQRAAPPAIWDLVILLLLLVLRRRLTELVALVQVEQRRWVRHERLLLIQDRSTHRLRRSLS